MKKMMGFFLCCLIFFGCQSQAETKMATVGSVGTGSHILIARSESSSLMKTTGELGDVMMGASLEDTDRDILRAQSPRTLSKIDKGEPLTVEDIKKMTKAGLSDHVIINQIGATQSVFYLSTVDIINLKQSHVSQKVIDYMIQTGNT